MDNYNMANVFVLQNPRHPSNDKQHSDNFELQLKHFYSLGRRRTGRSITLARVLVETAIETGETIKICDHYIFGNTHNALRNMVSAIKYVINAYQQEGLEMRVCFYNRETELSIHLHPACLNVYNMMRIENNPNMFRPIPEIKPNNKRKLLLLLE